MVTIASQSFELESPGAQYSNSATDGAVLAQDVIVDIANNAGQSPVDSTAASAGTLGFNASWQNTRLIEGLSDGDFVGITDFSGAVGSFTDGSQGYQFNDTDGNFILTFDAVDISTFENVNVSLDYFVPLTGWEADDVITITVNTDVETVTILDTTGSDIDNLGIEGTFLTGIAPISDGATTAQLIVTLDSNSGAESLYIDNIVIEGDTAGSSAFDLQITEIWAGQTGTDVTADWFEITNEGTAPWVSGTDPALFYDDVSQDPADATVIAGITQLDPGESAVVVIGDASDSTIFTDVWNSVIDLTGVEVGFTDGAGLGQDGDAVNVWVGDPNLTGSLVDTEAIPVAPSGISYDVTSEAFSVVGQDNAVATLVLGGTNGTEPAIGSPGNGDPIVVAPTIDLVISEVMFNPASDEDDWEWVELFNAGNSAVDLSGFVLDDNNGTAVGSANIASGVIEAGATAVLYNTDDVSATDFSAAWGAGINLIPVTDWSALQLNNGGDTVGLWDSFANYTGDNQTQANALISVTYPNIDDGFGSVYLTDLADPSSFALSTDGVATPAGGSAYTSRAAGGNSGSDIGSPGGFISEVEPPVASDPDLFQRIGGLTGLSGAEVSAFDAASQRLFVTDGSTTLQVFDLSDPANPAALSPIDVSTFGTGANSVAVSGGVIAVAIQANPNPGTVAFYDADTGTLLDSTTVGVLPDMLTFTPDGSKVLVANEGEPDGGTDPEGSVSVIDFNDTNVTNVATADFSGFDAATLRAAGVRIFPNKTVAEDVEPEYIAVSDDSTTAFVTLQENNAVAVVDIATATVTAVQPLGLKDYSVAGNELDASDSDGIPGRLETEPVLGLYQPDAIAAFTIAGQTYTITADEGDARSEDARIGSLTLDPTAFPDAATLQQDENLGRLEVSTLDGDTDGDGDFDQLVAYGGRSFTIRDAAGNIVFNSGNQLEALGFANSEDPDGLDGRSDNKGPEPEGVTVGVIGDRTYAFIGLERASGTAVYDVTNPAAPTFVQYLATSGDISPEGLTFIPAAESPNGENLLVVTNEVSNSISIYATDLPDPATISEIQGSGDVSPLLDTTVLTSGIVTRVLIDPDGDDSGFYIQTPDAQTDGDSATSEGVFVLTGSAPQNSLGNLVAVGDAVEVIGTVQERFGQTTVSVDSSTNIDFQSADNVLPEAVQVSLPGLNQSDLEAFEGMRFELVSSGADPLVVIENFNLDRFGEITVAEGIQTQPTQIFDPETQQTEIQTLIAQNTNERLLLDDGNFDQNPTEFPYLPATVGDDGDGILDAEDTFSAAGPTVRLAAELTTSVQGVLGFGFSEYRLFVDNTIGLDSATNEGSRPQSAPEVGGDLTVASFNVLNYFTTIDVSGAGTGPNGDLNPRGADTDDELVRQTAKLVAALAELDADIVGLQEIENNGITAISTLVSELNTFLGAPVYDFVDPTGTQDFIGTDAITTGFIYKPSEVSVVTSDVLVFEEASAATTFALADVLNQVASDDDQVGDFQRNRPAVAATFQDADGEQFTVAVNHFKSKGDSNLEDVVLDAQSALNNGNTTITQNDIDALIADPNYDQGDGQGFWNQVRADAGAELVEWLTDTSVDGYADGTVTDPDFIIIGDLNAYAQEDPLNAIEAGANGESFDDLIDGFVPGGQASAYSFVFDGQRGSLDHALSNGSLTNQVTGAAEWHINADEPDLLNYDDSFNDSRFFNENLFGASDHDPLIIGLDLGPTVKGQPATIYVNSSNIVVGNSFQAGETYAGALSSNTDLIFNTANNPDDVILGTAGDDNIWGGSDGSDVIEAGAGNDTVGFGDGDAHVDAGAGDDFVYAAGAGAGTNIIDLGSGTDSFFATAGNHDISGTDANTIGIGTGNDTVTTGDGDDFVYTVSGGGGTNILNLGNGINTVFVESGDYTITTGSGNDSIGLGTGTDVINAGDGDNLIYMIDPAGTNDGPKDILTGSGDDFVQTGSGDDLIDAGAGINTLFGGAGMDTFTLRSGAYNFLGDFEVGVDQIDLEGLNFTDLTFFQGTDEVAADTFIFVGEEAIGQVANTIEAAINDSSLFI